MKIIVVGCGRVGAELAYRLYERGHKVVVVDQNRSAFDNLLPDFQGLTVEGEALNRDVLRRAGIEQADGLAVVTSSDSLNAVVGHIGKDVYHVASVIVRNYDPRWRTLHESFGHQVVGSSSWGAQRIEELLYHQELHTVYSAGNGEVEAYEFTVPEAWDGKVLADLIPEKGCVPTALTRAGRAIIPDCDTVLKTADVVVVTATFEGIRKLRTELVAHHKTLREEK